LRKPGSLPAIGSTFVVEGDLLPHGATVVGMFGFDRHDWLGTPLPLSLEPWGAMGCTLYLHPAKVATLVNDWGRTEWRLDIPNNPMLRGVEFYQQLLIVDPAANAFGVAMTNAVGGAFF
jgi:hypothetical protein